MRLKVGGALILWVVAVVAKTYLEKLTPKARRTSYNFTSGKSSRSSSRKLLDTFKNNFFLLEVHLMYIYFLRKSQFRNFDSFQHERLP